MKVEIAANANAGIDGWMETATTRPMRIRLLERRTWLVLQAFFLLPVAGFWVRAFGLPSFWQRVQRRFRAKAIGSAHAAKELALLKSAVARASQLHWHWPQCLEQSLTLACLLAPRGYDAELCFGILPDMDPPTAHCWLEWNGAAIGEAPASRGIQRLEGSATLRIGP